MDSGRRTPVRTKFGAMFMLMGLLTGLLATVAPRADAAPVGPDVVGGFEIDGDQVSPPGGTVDWVDFADLTPAHDADSLTVLVDAISPDNGLQGSSKEDEPEGFTCQDKSPTVTPGKDNLVRAYVNTRATGLDSIFLDLAFVRSDGGTQGDSHVNFEFNQNPVTNLCPYTSRTDGDLLITFDFPGNSALPAEVQTFAWDSDAPDGADEPGKWIAFDFEGDIAAEDNIAQIDDQIVGGTVAARAFGEASINLVDLAEQSGASSDGCASFGFASVRSRSSGQSFSSALQDILGGPVDVTTCGKIIVHKEDDAGNALEGATFGLWPASATVPAVGADGTRPSTGSIDTCSSLADGTCTFDEVDPGDYKVAELSAPAGYDIDPDVVSVTVGFRETVDVAAAFENPRDTGYVDVTKVVTGTGAEAFDAAALEGLRFFLTTDPDEDPVSLWPPSDPPESAECSLDGLSLTCTIGPVALGDYFVNEDATTLPAGLDAGPAVKATVDEDGEHVAVSYTNETDLPGVSVAKTTSTPTVDAGDGVAFSITLTNDSDVAGTVSFTDNLPDAVTWAIDGTPPSGCALDGSNDLVCTDLIVPAQSSVTIDLSGTSDPTDCPSITNPEFEISVLDEPAELASDNTAEAVTINISCPDVTVVKTTETPSVTPGGAVGFDITITNEGDGVAKDVSFDDDLPDGVTWSFSGDVPEGCALVANDLSCSFAELDAGQSVVVHLIGTVDAADCPSITNPVSTVSASNEAASATGNNSTTAVTITVTCPPPPPPPPPPSPIDIEIVKDGPALAHRGDEITYSFTVTNTGDVALVTVVLSDPICDDGTIALVDDGNGDTTLAVDEVWTYECTRVITDTDPDPLPNTATVRGTDVQGRTTDDADDHEVDLIEPAIQIVKTVDDDSPGEGQTVTFTYVVTNTGDTTLFDVEVVDDQLGAIGTIDELAPGESVALTKTMVVAVGSPSVNVGTATGADVLGKSVTDDDDATITIVLGEVITRPAELPRTGADTQPLVLLSGFLVLVGGLLVASGSGAQLLVRRRQP